MREIERNRVRDRKVERKREYPNSNGGLCRANIRNTILSVICTFSNEGSFASEALYPETALN